MKDYVVTGHAFDIPAGVKVKLSPEQYECRKHAVKPIEGEPGIYETVRPIQFKEGEQVSTSLDVGKSQMVQIVPVKLGDDPKANEVAIAEAKAKSAPEAAPQAKEKKKGFLK